MVADLAIYASVYQPEVASLGLTEPAEFAQVARPAVTPQSPPAQTL